MRETVLVTAGESETLLTERQQNKSEALTAGQQSLSWTEFYPGSVISEAGVRKVPQCNDHLYLM